MWFPPAFRFRQSIAGRNRRLRPFRDVHNVGYDALARRQALESSEEDWHMRSASRLPPGSRHRAVAVLSLALLLALLSACGKGSGDDPTRALSPAPTTAARASVLAATATAVAV